MSPKLPDNQYYFNAIVKLGTQVEGTLWWDILNKQKNIHSLNMHVFSKLSIEINKLV